ncbi:uncharacterized protein L203_100188 [Cryptococcus depauperatus CBS 7841]|uniref:DUF3835 domain-containing protein n=1 Tax=Cryptococcus depauperatus CBS 7841 TaxID=1295531 RepID=A0AAJ8JML9_9TREE
MSKLQSSKSFISKIADIKSNEMALNEQGLPFHEIRETLQGVTIGPPPPVSDTLVFKEILEEADDYWSQEAIKRRAKLKRRVFREGDGSDEEEFNEELTKVKTQTENATSIHPPTLSPTLSVQHTSLPSSPKTPPTHSIIRNPGSEPAHKSNSALQLPAKKKVVSFDPAILISPESPETEPPFANRLGFPLPLVTEEDEWHPKPVPVINVPKPRTKGGDGFAGFKKGFLGPPRVRSIADDLQNTSSTSSVENVPSPDQQMPVSQRSKKKSLFAQRLADEEVDVSAPVTSSSNPGTQSAKFVPKLPRMTENKGAGAVKESVVEKPLFVPRSNTEKVIKKPVVPNEAAAVSKKVERGNNMDGFSPSIPTNNPTTTSTATVSDCISRANQGISENEENSEGSFIQYSDDSEDEYDLDDALLAREVALEYHKRHVYTSMNHDPLEIPMNVEENKEENRNNGIPLGVLLGLPSIQQKEQGQVPIIVNPTPDDLKKFVRVGKLENGNLILAPGQEGLSDSETDGDDNQGENEDETREKQERRQEVKRRRDKVRKQLMGLPVEESETPSGKITGLTDANKDGLPATLASTVTERPVGVQHGLGSTSTSNLVETKAEISDKKVSRFKAARMAASQR